jgi:excisionase family DNA binding protein
MIKYFSGDAPVEDEQSKWMSMQEAMEALRVSRSTIDLYARQGKLKRFQRGRNVYFLREQVEKLKEPKPKP